METQQKVDIIKQAIQQLMEEDEGTNCATPPSPSSYDGDTRRRRNLLTELLSQLESMERDEECVHKSKQDTYGSMLIGKEDKTESCSDKENDDVSKSSSVNEEEIIIKELKNVQRQNTITHCLVSAMIVLTLVWQLSEVSLILRIKDGLSNPLKSIGGMFGGFFKGRRHPVDVQEAIKQVSAKQKDMFMEPASLPGLKLPDLELPCLDSSDWD